MPAINIFTGRNATVIAILSFFTYLTYRLVLLGYPHPDAGGVENNVIWFVQRLLDGGHLYTNPEASPYAVAQYGPLYYYLVTGVAKLAGAGPDDVLTLFAVSRSVSVILNMLFAMLCVGAAKNIFAVQTKQALIAGVFAFIFLEITSFSRPDSLNHVFFLGSFYLFGISLTRQQENRPASFYLPLSAIVAALALFSKQSSFILPLIMLVWFVRNRNTRQFLIWFASYAATALLLLLVVHLESGLKPFFQNTILGINNGVSLFWFWNLIIREFYSQFGILWVAGLLFLCTTITKRSLPTQRFLSTSIIVSFLFSNLIALKWGSSPGYFTEWTALVFIGVAAHGNTVLEAANGLLKRAAAGLVMVICLVKVLLISYSVWDMIKPGAAQAGLAKFHNEKQLAAFVQSKLQNPGNTIFNNMYSPDTYLNNLLFRRSVLPQYEVVIFGTWNNKVFDYTQFKKELADGTIRYIVQPGDKAPAFMDADLSGFRQTDSLFNYYRIYQLNR